MKNVDKEEIDVYCVYCPQTELCYYVDPEDFCKVKLPSVSGFFTDG